MLVEIDHPFNIEFRTENIKEDILTLALVELADGVGQFVEHGKALRGVALAGHHACHLILKLHRHVPYSELCKFLKLEFIMLQAFLQLLNYRIKLGNPSIKYFYI